MQIFFQKDLLTLTYSHFLFYAWLGISASWERPPFVELREPETQLKEIKKGWDKIWEVKFDPLCGPLLQLKMKFTDLKKKSHLLKFRQFFSFPSRWPYCVYSLLSATFHEAFRAWNLTRVTHLKKKVNWWNFCHSIGKDSGISSSSSNSASNANQQTSLLQILGVKYLEGSSFLNIAIATENWHTHSVSNWHKRVAFSKIHKSVKLCERHCQ